MNEPELRRFMPGACGPEGQAAKIFAESDRRPSAQIFLLAKEVCRNCLQLPYCSDQREAIAQTLHNNGVKVAVVGAQTVPMQNDLRYLTQRERLTLEPKFQFNTAEELPSNPLTTLVLLRQWARINRRALSGKTPSISLWAAEVALEDNELMCRIEKANLARQEALATLHYVAKVLVAYARKEASPSTWARRPPEAQLNMDAFRKVAPLYLADAEKIKALGLEPRLSLYYDADFWQRLFAAYEASQCVTQLEVKYCCEKTPRDPIPSIETIIERSNLRRKKQYKNIFQMPAAVRNAEAERLEQELKETHPYITRAMINKALTTSSLKAAHKRIEHLKQPHIAEVANELHGKLNCNALQYCLMFSPDPRQAARDYLHRVEEISDQIKDAGYNIALSEIESYALRSLNNMTIGEIVAAIEAIQLRRDFTQGCKRLTRRSQVPGWVFDKIVHNYDRGEWWEVAGNLNQLIEMNILSVNHLSCALEGEAADVEGFLDHAVGKKGAYITFTLEAYDRFDVIALEALVRNAKLDLFVYGRKLPPGSPGEFIPPLLLKVEEIASLEHYIRKGGMALRILNGEIPLPKEILLHYGWPNDPEARKNALSALRNSALRGRQIKRAHHRARLREKLT